MTYLKVKRDLLMSIDSLLAAVPVWLYLSLPARSTNYNLLQMTLSGCLVSMHSTVRVNIE